MRQLIIQEVLMALSKGRKPHYIDMDGFKCYYEKIGRRAK